MVLQLQLWQLPLLMCLAGLLLSDICRGEHLVQIQEGPLYRVKGYPMSISCNVSGYSGQADQGFAFSVYKPDYPEKEIRMISTFDPHYAYRVYRDRVIEKSIEIKRLSKTSVILHLKLLQADDAGVFECYTPNIYDTYMGTYNGKTTLNVIEDTLKASFSSPASYSISEGESLQLECEVSSQTMQHTHLSVTWYLRGNTETLPIITLDRDLTVRPGAAFEKQYHSGLISIEKVEDTTYRLKMSQVQQSARGEIYCQAEEWIQDPDRSWIRIAYKNTTGSNVEIKALEVIEVGSFIAAIDVSETLQEGEKAVIRCSVQAQNLLGRFFSITWLRNSMEVAQIGPSGVLTVANEYKERENKGELTAVKISDNAYVLTIRPVRAEDHGQYQCKATQEERVETGKFTRGQSQLSSEKTVHIEAKESGLAVVMAEKLINMTEGKTLKLTCSVSKASGPLSVSWQHRKSTSSPFRDVISMNHEGVMVRGPGAQYQDRIVRTFRSTATDFTLEISGAVLSDSGEYKCTVSEWNMDRNGSINSQSALVSVESIDSSLKVSLRSRDTNVTENSLITMICTVKGPKVPLDVHWKFKSGSDAQKDIICMLRNGAISCGREQKDYQLEAQVQDTITVFYLRILKASRKQQGTYQCQITAYQESVQKAQKHSNDLAVSVHAPVSKLSLSISPKAYLDIPIKSNAKIDCLVDKAVSNSSRFAVTWIFDAQTLVKMDSEGVVTLGPAASKEINQRINMQMIERRTFQLAIQEVRSTDRGQYKCLVEEWIQDPDGIWYPLHPKSVTMDLVVNEQASDFSLNKSDAQLVVTEGQQVDLSCLLHTNGLDSTFRYSLIWSFERQDQKAPMVPLLTYSHDGRLQFSSDDPKLQRRLYFSRPTVSDFRLSILNSISSDTGRYRCQVDQYQLDCKGKWEFKAGDKSGFTNVNVLLIENKLQVKKVSRSLNVTDYRAGFTVECEISSRSSDKSHFEVTWTKSQEDGQPTTIFTARRDGTLSDAFSDRNLLYSRPLATLYRLTLPDVEPSDNGRYQCQVVEWLQTDTWREVAKDKSGELFVHVESEKKPSTGTFVLEKPNSHLNLTEGERFVLNCSILVDKADPTFHYTVTWLLVKQETRTSLLKHSKDGRLQYQSEDQQLNSRLQSSRSTVTNFHLTVFNSLPTDSGTYQCMVEQHQLGCGGTWESKGPAQFISTSVTVRSIESKLQVRKESHSLNLTAHHAALTVECQIISHSSDKSVFEVIWSKSQEKDPPMTFFRVMRDGTLHSAFRDRNLVYEHPSANLYLLTVPDVEPSDNGWYQCQVVEWLQTATNTWREVAKDKSGELSVHVHVEAAPSEVCSSGMILGILTPLLFILLVVIVLLLLMVQKTKSASKKQKDCLWAENNPLKPFPEPTAGEGDSA
ncbi:immunoglobulin superfamily member 3 [Colossoma macropomum]|uniref:immunoglobulin superfamily member 3 n=1 Tax=Colossoma macropomum TaxID=42526 RepID=UPI0018643A68|nr:immunoglobulin superfamily member 3 [Colossoma macropomum]